MKTYNLRHVQNDNGGLKTHTNTSNETTGNDGSKRRRTDTSDHLNDDTDHVDEAAKNNSPLASHPVGNVTSNESTEESTAGKDRDDEGGIRFANGGGTLALDGLDEVDGTQDTVDVTGVVSEEDTSKGGKGADQVGLPCDGGLNLVDIVGDGEALDGLARNAGFFLHCGGCC